MNARADAYPALVTAFAVIGIAWQLAIVALAYRHAVVLASAMTALEVELPVSTRTFLATYHWWFVLPLMSIGAAYVAHRQAASAPKRAVIAAVVPLAIAAALQTWTNEAVLAPLRAILDRVG
jgi:hypothetical protein